MKTWKFIRQLDEFESRKSNIRFGIMAAA